MRGFFHWSSCPKADTLPAPRTVHSPPPCGEGSGVGVHESRSLDRPRQTRATSSTLTSALQRVARPICLLAPRSAVQEERSDALLISFSARRPPPPTPPRKGEGSSPFLRRDVASPTDKARTPPAPPALDHRARSQPSPGVTLPWRGRVASRGAKRHVRRGGVISPRPPAPAERSPHPARPLRARATLPLQGRVRPALRHHLIHNLKQRSG